MFSAAGMTALETDVEKSQFLLSLLSAAISVQKEQGTCCSLLSCDFWGTEAVTVLSLEGTLVSRCPDSCKYRQTEFSRVLPTPKCQNKLKGKGPWIVELLHPICKYEEALHPKNLPSNQSVQQLEALNSSKGLLWYLNNIENMLEFLSQVDKLASESKNSKSFNIWKAVKKI